MVRISGPAIGTRAILVTLSEAAGTEMGWRNFTGDGGALVSAVLSTGLGTGQLHSRHGREEDSGYAFVKHGCQKGS